MQAGQLSTASDLGSAGGGGADAPLFCSLGGAWPESLAFFFCSNCCDTLTARGVGGVLLKLVEWQCPGSQVHCTTGKERRRRKKKFTFSLVSTVPVTKVGLLAQE